MTRTSRRLAGAGLAVLLLSGCGGVGRAGAAALVGDDSISSDTLQSAVERGLGNPVAAEQFSANRADYQLQVLNRMVRFEILDEAAERAGVTVTEGDVDEQLQEFADQLGGQEELERQAAEGGIAPSDLAQFARQVVLEERLGDELTEDLDVPDAQLEALYQQELARYDQVATRHILVEDEAAANEILGQLQADRSQFAAIAAARSIDTSNADSGGDLGLQGRGTFVPEFEEAVFGAEPGSLVVVQTQFGWHVVEVLERETTSLADATPELRRNLLAEPRQERLTGLLQETAEDLGVTVNPRFGRWNAEQVAVVAAPADNGLSSPVPQEAPGGAVGPAPGGRPPAGGQAPPAPQGGQPAPQGAGQPPADVQPG